MTLKAKRSKAPIGADFRGAACPPGSTVRFSAAGRLLSGRVAALQRRHATVQTAADGRWKVGYGALEVVERAGGECRLDEVWALGNALLDRHAGDGGLSAAWRFGFDLAPARAGICRYAERRIDLSASFCLLATRSEVRDTILHEIAHAIVGKEHGHDTVWQAKAGEIGCSAERTHGVRHTAARWIGECGCGSVWHRQRLQRRIAGGRCSACGGEIAWRANEDPGC